MYNGDETYPVRKIKANVNYANNIARWFENVTFSNANGAYHYLKSKINELGRSYGGNALSVNRRKGTSDGGVASGKQEQRPTKTSNMGKGSGDSRLSLTSSDENYTKSNRELVKENQKLSEQVKLLKREMQLSGGHVMDDATP